jgi:predicted nucleic acid-binding protein
VTNTGPGVVVDTSVVAKWRLNDEDLLGEARLLLDRYIAQEIMLFAPSLIRYELANTFAKARRVGRLSTNDVIDGLRDFFALRIQALADEDALIVSASRLAERLGLSAYDATYVALAEELGITLVTNDQGILASVLDYPVAACSLKDVRSLL